MLDVDVDVGTGGGTRYNTYTVFLLFFLHLLPPSFLNEFSLPCVAFQKLKIVKKEKNRRRK